MEEEKGKRLDLISSLPHEILHKILSFLPQKEALRASILSTSWNHLWAPIQVQVNMDLSSDQTVAQSKLIKYMAAFLKSHDNPKKWKFCLNCEDDLAFMAAKGREERDLHLDFSGREQTTRSFHLVLSPNHLNLTPSLSSVKTLHLSSINHQASELVSVIFFHCHLLESLKLERCHGLESIDIRSNGSFKSLAVIDCQDRIRVIVCAPNLKSFLFRGALPRIQLENCPHLADAIIDLGDGGGQNSVNCEEVLSLLASLQDIEILTISGWLLQWLCTTGVVFRELQFQFSKLKELHWIGSLMDQSKRDSLACFLNASPSLESLIVDIAQRCSSTSCPVFQEFWHNPQLWEDHGTKTLNASLQLKHLKVVKLVGFTDRKDELLLIDFLLRKAANLKSMIMTTPDDQSWLVSKIPLSQRNHRSTCHTREIGMSFPNKNYFFRLRKVGSNCLY